MQASYLQTLKLLPIAPQQNDPLVCNVSKKIMRAFDVGLLV